MTAEAHQADDRSRPLLGLRNRPGRLALQAMRLPRPLYRRGWGRLLGHVFLMITHVGRKTGKPRDTVAMALTYNRETREVVVCSAWGAGTDWIRNLRANPALRIEIGSKAYVPKHRFLTEDESVAVAVEFRARHPWRLRLFSRILGWGAMDSDQAIREFVRTRPFVLFQPHEADDAPSSARTVRS